MSRGASRRSNYRWCNAPQVNEVGLNISIPEKPIVSLNTTMPSAYLSSNKFLVECVLVAKVEMKDLPWTVVA